MNDEQWARPWRTSPAEPHKVLSASGLLVAECNAKDERLGFLGVNDDHAAMIVACVNAGSQEDTLRGLQGAIVRWADATFPNRVAAIAFMKLFEEIGEVVRDPFDRTEWADVLFLVLDLMAMHGITDPDTAVQEKLEINRRRRWAVGPSGTMHNRGTGERE